MHTITYTGPRHVSQITEWFLTGGTDHYTDQCPNVDAVGFQHGDWHGPAAEGFICTTCVDVDTRSYPRVSDPMLPTRTAGPGFQVRGTVQVDLATDKQVAFITRLAAERNHLVTLDGLTKRDASKLIETLLAMPKVPQAVPTAPQDVAQACPKVTATQPTPKVASGRYAVENEDGVLRFYRVNTPTEGRWAGRTFVDVQASDELYPVKGDTGRAILTKIAANPAEAMARYGLELGRCGHCNRTLTDEQSRERGIGPICAAKMGW